MVENKKRKILRTSIFVKYFSDLVFSLVKNLLVLKGVSILTVSEASHGYPIRK